MDFTALFDEKGLSVPPDTPWLEAAMIHNDLDIAETLLKNGVKPVLHSRWIFSSPQEIDLLERYGFTFTEEVVLRHLEAEYVTGFCIDGSLTDLLAVIGALMERGSLPPRDYSDYKDSGIYHPDTRYEDVNRFFDFIGVENPLH